MDYFREIDDGKKLVIVFVGYGAGASEMEVVDGNDLSVENSYKWGPGLGTGEYKYLPGIRSLFLRTHQKWADFSTLLDIEKNRRVDIEPIANDLVVVNDQLAATVHDDGVLRMYRFPEGSQRISVNDSGRMSPELEISLFGDSAAPDWVSVTPAGFFSGTNGAFSQMLLKRQDTVLEMDHFFDGFYRPEMVAEILSGRTFVTAVDAGSLDVALENPPPVVEIKEDPTSTDDGRAEINFRIQSTGGGIAEIRGYHNGKLVHSEGAGRAGLGVLGGRASSAINASVLRELMRGALEQSGEEVFSRGQAQIPSNADEVEGKLVVEPVSGENQISILAFNRANTVRSRVVTRRIWSEIAPRESRLFVLAM